MSRARYDEVSEDLVNSPRRWLVTGVAGFIGSALLERLLDLGQSVTGVDNFLTGHKKNLDDVLAINPDERLQFQFIEGDLRDLSSLIAVVEQVQPDEVYNLGAISFVQLSFKQAELTAETLSIPIARVLRDGRGHLLCDEDFIPPCLRLRASEPLMLLARRLLDALGEKSSTVSRGARRHGRRHRLGDSESRRGLYSATPQEQSRTRVLHQFRPRGSGQDSGKADCGAAAARWMRTLHRGSGK